MDDKDFKRWQVLSRKEEDGTITQEEQSDLDFLERMAQIEDEQDTITYMMW